MAALLAQLRTLRESRGLSQARLAETTGIQRTHISRAERGLRGLDVVALEKYLAAIGYEIRIVAAGQPPLDVAVAGLSGSHQDMLTALARILPAMPDALVDDLHARIRDWTARYGGAAT